MLYKKIKDGVVKRACDEYDKIIESLGKISGLTKDQTEECV